MVADNPKVSVIIPVYNVEKYIIDCLESVKNQTFKDYEVIIVNDGTPDKSAELAEEYIKSNGLNNFHLINKENGWVSSAKNEGIRRAKGEWMTFIDSDDFIEENYLLAMVEALEKYPADICITGFTRYIEETGERQLNNRDNFYYGDFTETMDGIFFKSNGAKLYSSKIIKDNSIFFDERLRMGEDPCFNFDYFSYVEKFLVIRDVSYVYRKRAGSMTNSKVRPQQKRYMYEHVRRFWLSFPDTNVILDAFRRNHHIGHNIIDAYLTEVIISVLDKDKEGYKKLMADEVGHLLVENYKHSSAPMKEKALVGLLKKRLNVIANIIIYLYYSDGLNRIIKPLLDKIK